MIDDTDFFIEAASLGASDYVVKISGPIDAGNASRLQEAILDALIAAPTRLTVNLASVNSIDGSGLDVLVSAYRRATAAGTRLLLQRAHPDLAQVLEQNGLPTKPEPTLDLSPASITAERPGRPAATPSQLNTNKFA
jgi:anti-sigma B factor antagonist